MTMLVLKRRVGESIVIDERITVKVLELKGTHVSLGIQAPPNVAVLREEIAGRTPTGEVAKSANRVESRSAKTRP